MTTTQNPSQQAMTPFDVRKAAIQDLEQKRSSRILTYITGDRPTGGPGLELAHSVEPNVVPVIYEALQTIGPTENIDLFLYTRGGAVDVVYPIVSLIREFAKSKFCVLIPFRAHSAGTLIAMGAHEIVMCEAAELTSVDPTTGNPFNPVDELVKDKRKGISVEDVTSYFSFAKENEKVKLTSPEHILEVFKQLTSQIHPLSLGHVQRVHTQIRMIAEKLLRLHLKNEDKKKISAIVSTLTEKLYSHTHAVNRRDAQKIFGKGVKFPEKVEHDLIWNIFQKYSDALELRTPQNLLSDLGQQQQLQKSYIRGYVETTQKSWTYESDLRISMITQNYPGVGNPNVQTELNKIQPIVPGLPLYIAGLPTQFYMDVLFEGWRTNLRGV